MFVSAKISVNVGNNKVTVVNLSSLENLLLAQCYDKNSCSLPEREIRLHNNPIICDCRTYDLVRYYQRKMKLSDDKSFVLRPVELKCVEPHFLRDRPLSSVNLNELHCPWHELLINGATGNSQDEANSCPSGCTCFFTTFDLSLTVNCSASGFNSNIKLPHQLPWAPFVKEVELLLSNRNLTSLKDLATLLESSNVTRLSLSSNKLENIDDLYIPSNLKVSTSIICILRSDGNIVHQYRYVMIFLDIESIDTKKNIHKYRDQMDKRLNFWNNSLLHISKYTDEKI